MEITLRANAINKTYGTVRANVGIQRGYPLQRNPRDPW